MAGSGAVTITTSALTLAAALGGYLLAGINDSRRDARAAKREERARRAAFAERLEESRHTFQRDTLLELQDELQRMIRINAKIIMEDRRSLQAGSGLRQLPAELSDEDYQTGVSIRRLNARVLDARMRELVEEFTGYCAHVAAAVPVFLKDAEVSVALAELDRYMDEMGRRYANCHSHIGALIRAELDRRYLVDPASTSTA